MPIAPFRESPPPRPSTPSREPAAAAVAGGSGAEPEGTAEPSPFAKLLSGLGREAKRGEEQMTGALAATRHGGDLGPSQLLALQAGVYRYSETVDLASKLVDRATTGVKTVVQGQ
jgi:hypothetical protein